jgi:hypothetical protein
VSATSFAPRIFRARRHAVGRPGALVAAFAVFAIAATALIALHPGPSPLPLRLSRAQHSVRADPVLGPLLPRLHPTRAALTPLDRSQEAIWFYDGPRLVLAAVVSRSGAVVSSEVPGRERYAQGSSVANDPRVLALLSLVFVLMTAAWPLWRLRNLDVAVAVGSVSTVVLLNAGLLSRMAMTSFALLLYLALRCAWVALAPPRARRPAVPLYEHLTAGWTLRRQTRLLRIAAVACSLIIVMVGLSSAGVVDVGYAVMEGATAILHGVLPYGHLGGIVHGDAYPFGSYLFYVPFALVSPVSNAWDSADVTLVVAVGAALLVAWGIFRTARRAPALHPQGASTELRGLRSAIAWLTFPPLLVTVSTGTTDVVLAVALLGALMLWRRPAASITLLAAAAWFKLIPVALMPLWLARLRGRALLRALLGVAGVSGALLVGLLLLGGGPGITAMAHGIAYQASRADPYSLWSLTGSAPFQQLAQAATLALLAGAVVRLRQDPALGADRGRIAALSAAILLGLQISAGYWSYMYLAWVFPFLALSLLAGDFPTARIEREGKVSKQD